MFIIGFERLIRELTDSKFFIILVIVSTIVIVALLWQKNEMRKIEEIKKRVDNEKNR